MYIEFTTQADLRVGGRIGLVDGEPKWIGGKVETLEVQINLNASPTDDPFEVEEAFINGVNADELGLLDFIDEIIDEEYDEIYRLACEAAQDYADARAEDAADRAAEARAINEGRL